MSTKSEEETFEPDMEELPEEEFNEDVDEDDEDHEQKSDSSEKGSKKSDSNQEVKNQGNTVDRYFWVDNIKPGTKTDKVQELFKKYGKVLAVKVIRGGSDGNLLAFIKFETPSDAQKCLDHLDGSEFMGNTIKILRERPTMPEEAKTDTKKASNHKRQFSPKRPYSPPKRHSDHHHSHHNRRGGSDRFRNSFPGSGGRGGFRGGYRDRGSFRDGAGNSTGGFERRNDFKRENFVDRRFREHEIRREREFFDLEKERLEVEKMKLKREREELEKLSSEIGSDRSYNDHKRPKNFDNSFEDSRRFDNFSRRDEIKRNDRFSPDRDRGQNRFSSSGGGGAMSVSTGTRSSNRFSSSANDRSFDHPKQSWTNQWDSHDSNQQHRTSWQSSSNFSSNGNSHSNDRGRYNGNSGMNPRISSSNNERGFGSSFGGNSGGGGSSHRRY